MDHNHFGDRLTAGWAASRFLCVGLDPDPEQVAATVGLGDPAKAVAAFTTAVVEATVDLALAYKPNSAFYEQFGPAGMDALLATIAHIHQVAPSAVVILDAKRGDIEHTNHAYARAMFDVYGADAVTVHPYLGGDALAPFIDRIDRGVIVLCRTSNPGGGEVQDLTVDGQPLYRHIASTVETTWNRNGNCGLLVGATYPREIALVRESAPTLPLLIAGVGRQQGALADAIRAGAVNRTGVIVSSSRSITDAATGPKFAAAARDAALRHHDAILSALDTA